MEPIYLETTTIEQKVTGSIPAGTRESTQPISLENGGKHEEQRSAAT